MATAPKLLTLDWTMTLEKRDDDILDSGGEANLDDLGKQMVIKSDILIFTWYTSWPRQKQHDKDAWEIAWLISVARAAPRCPS